MVIPRPGPEVIKPFSCSAQLSMILIMLINVKMPTLVGIFTFNSMMNMTPDILTLIKVCIFQHFSLRSS